MSIPQLPADLRRWRQAIERRLEQLETARRLIAATIGSGGLRVTGGGSITIDSDGTIAVYDDQDPPVLRVAITSGGITVRDADGDVRWTDATAWAGTVDPDATVSDYVNGSAWVDICSWTWRDTAEAVEAGVLVQPDAPGTAGELRLLDTSDAFAAETIATATGLSAAASGQPYMVRIGGDCVAPDGTDYQRVKLQARTTGGTGMGVEAIGASFSA